jgi:hypothetical protein
MQFKKKNELRRPQKTLPPTTEGGPGKVTPFQIQINLITLNQVCHPEDNQADLFSRPGELGPETKFRIRNKSQSLLWC